MTRAIRPSSSSSVVVVQTLIIFSSCDLVANAEGNVKRVPAHRDVSTDSSLTAATIGFSRIAVPQRRSSHHRYLCHHHWPLAVGFLISNPRVQAVHMVNQLYGVCERHFISVGWIVVERSTCPSIAACGL